MKIQIETDTNIGLLFSMNIHWMNIHWIIVGVENLKFNGCWVGSKGHIDGDEVGTAAVGEEATFFNLLAWNFAALRLSRLVFHADFFLGVEFELQLKLVSFVFSFFGEKNVFLG